VEDWDIVRELSLSRRVVQVDFSEYSYRQLAHTELNHCELTFLDANRSHSDLIALNHQQPYFSPAKPSRSARNRACARRRSHLNLGGGCSQTSKSSSVDELDLRQDFKVHGGP
jgi:hypothetical protein